MSSQLPELPMGRRAGNLVVRFLGYDAPLASLGVYGAKHVIVLTGQQTDRAAVREMAARAAKKKGRGTTNQRRAFEELDAMLLRASESPTQKTNDAAAVLTTAAMAAAAAPCAAPGTCVEVPAKPLEAKTTKTPKDATGEGVLASTRGARAAEHQPRTVMKRGAAAAGVVPALTPAKLDELRGATRTTRASREGALWGNPIAGAPSAEWVEAKRQEDAAAAEERTQKILAARRALRERVRERKGKEARESHQKPQRVRDGCETARDQAAEASEVADTERKKRKRVCDVNRREKKKSVSAVGERSPHVEGRTAAGTVSPRPSVAWSTDRPPRVTVVGAGPSGLCAARLLQLYGVETTVLEARDRIGGRIMSDTLPARPEHNLPSCTIDLGASFVHGCNPYNPLYVMARETGATLDNAEGGYSSGWGSYAAWYDAKAGGLVTRRSVQRAFKVVWALNDSLAELQIPRDEATATRMVQEERADPPPAAIAHAMGFTNDVSRGKQCSTAAATAPKHSRDANKDTSMPEADATWTTRGTDGVTREALAATAAESSDDAEEGRWRACGEWGALAVTHQGSVEWGAGDVEKERTAWLTAHADARRDLSLAAALKLATTKCPGLHRRFLSSVEEAVLESAKVVMWGYNASLRDMSTRVQQAFKMDIEQAKEELQAVTQKEQEALTGRRDPGEPREQQRSAASGWEPADRNPPSAGAMTRARGIHPRTPSPKQSKGADGNRTADAPLAADALPPGTVTPRGGPASTPSTGPANGWSKGDKRPVIKTGAAGGGSVMDAFPEDEDVDLSDGLVVGGYHDLVIARAAEGLTVRTGQRVMSIAVGDGASPSASEDCSWHDTCRVTTQSGEVIESDYVVVALPLGVLQSRSERSAVTFKPPLSDAKRMAIAAVGMGTENKVVLRFERPFWPPRARFFQCTDQRFRFLNAHAYGKPNTIVAHLAPPFAEGFCGLSDDEVIAEVTSVMRRMFKAHLRPSEPLPKILDSRVTRWGEDPFSCGAYSYMRVGSDPSDIAALAAPEYDGRVHFAGEACSVEGAQCVHGALLTGQSAAAAVLRQLGVTVRTADLLGGEVGIPGELPTDSWVQCSLPACQRWRRLPHHVSPEGLPDDWECSMCTWHDGLREDACGAPQEPWDELPGWAKTSADLTAGWNEWTAKQAKRRAARGGVKGTPPREKDEDKGDDSGGGACAVDGLALEEQATPKPTWEPQPAEQERSEQQRPPPSAPISVASIVEAAPTGSPLVGTLPPTSLSEVPVIFPDWVTTAGINGASLAPPPLTSPEWHNGNSQPLTLQRVLRPPFQSDVIVAKRRREKLASTALPCATGGHETGTYSHIGLSPTGLSG